MAHLLEGFYMLYWGKVGSPILGLRMRPSGFEPSFDHVSRLEDSEAGSMWGRSFGLVMGKFGSMVVSERVACEGF